jgi:hypothetical protein
METLELTKEQALVKEIHAAFDEASDTLAGAHSPETAPRVHPVFDTLLAAMRGDFGNSGKYVGN